MLIDIPVIVLLRPNPEGFL